MSTAHDCVPYDCQPREPVARGHAALGFRYGVTHTESLRPLAYDMEVTEVMVRNDLVQIAGTPL